MSEFIIRTKTYEEKIEADNAEDAMNKFVLSMDLNMYNYFSVVTSTPSNKSSHIRRAEDMKYRNCKTYIINSKDLTGGRDFKEYSWKEVLDYFNAPDDIKSIDELVSWEEKDGMAFMYLVEEWHEYDKHGIILS